MNVQICETTGDMLITIPSNMVNTVNPGLSSSGKSRLVAKFSGPMPNIVVNDRAMVLSLNAYVPEPKGSAARKAVEADAARAANTGQAIAEAADAAHNRQLSAQHIVKHQAPASETISVADAVTAINGSSLRDRIAKV